MAAAADEPSTAEAVIMPSLADTQALPLILAHPSILQAPCTIVRLMAASAALQQAVHTWCAGAVPITMQGCSSAAVSSFSSWAARHARLMRSLTVPTMASFEDGSALVAALEAAAAEADGGQLKLESLSTSYLSAALLQRLCSRSLRRLSACAISSPAEAAPALAALSSLRSLRLAVVYPQLCPALLCLSTLEDLELCQLQDSQADLECYLPSRLKRLTVPGSWHQPGSKLQLGHLTALTAISAGASNNSSGFSVFQGDVLPPALQHLDTRGLASPEPLLPLRQLRGLSVRDCRCSAEQLAQLGSSLPGLAGVTLSFWSTERAANAAGGLASLPLHSLWLGSCGAAPLQLATLECLGGLTGLTSLSLTCKVGASAQQLSRVLAKLTQLRELSVWKPDLVGGSTAGDGSGGALASLLGGITGLPRLASLTLSGLRCSQPQELRQLGAAGAFGGGLTGLVLNDIPGLTDSCMEAALLEVGCDSETWLGASLRALDLSRNDAVGDSSLAAVARCLQQLTQLQVLGTRVTDTGVAGLSRLRHLRQLAVPERVRAAARAQALAGCRGARGARSGCGGDADACSIDGGP